MPARLLPVKGTLFAPGRTLQATPVARAGSRGAKVRQVGSEKEKNHPWFRPVED